MKQHCTKRGIKLAGLLLVPLLCVLLLVLPSGSKEPISVAFSGCTNMYGRTFSVFRITNHTSQAFDLSFRPEALDGGEVETFSSLHRGYAPVFNETIEAGGSVESLWANPMSAEKWHLLVRCRPKPSRYEDAKRSIYHWLDEYGFERLKRVFRSEMRVYSQAVTNPSVNSW